MENLKPLNKGEVSQRILPLVSFEIEVIGTNCHASITNVDEVDHELKELSVNNETEDFT